MSPRNPEQNERMRQTTLRKICDVSLRIFAENGYHGASIGQILQATGLSKGVLYHYFPSKAELFLHLNRTAFQISRGLLERAMNAEGTAWEKIEVLASLTVNEALKNEIAPYALISLMAMAEGKGIPGIEQLIEEQTSEPSYYTNLNHLISEAQKAGDAVGGDPDLLASAFLSLIQGLALMMFHDTGLENRITPELLTNLLRR